MRRRATLFAFGASVLLVAALLSAFPGQRFRFAFVIATGVGRAGLQQQIDRLEEQAIARREFTADDRQFLSDFYRTLATGGRLSIVAAQTGKLMHHYLDGSGREYELEPEIFTENIKVQGTAQALLQRAKATTCADGQRFSSGSFYMPDPSKIDSVFGLYHGTLVLTQSVNSAGECVRRWRAEVPWVWPSYESLRKKYGRSHAESFPLPNLQSIVLGRESALLVDNGLGQYLEELGLAKSFTAFAQWTDE